jgi:hypothetical protein
LRLIDPSNQVPPAVPHVGLDDHQRGAEMNRLRESTDVAAGDTAEEIRLRLYGGGSRSAGREVSVGADATGRVRHSHDDASVKHAVVGAKVDVPFQPYANLVRTVADD